MRNESLPLNDPGGLGIFAVMARALTPFQPDFGAHWDMREPAAPAIPDKAPPPGPIERLERWFWSRRQRDLEAYLGHSRDIHDLEARIRSLERNPSHPYY